MFFGKVMGGVTMNRPVPAKYHPSNGTTSALLEPPLAAPRTDFVPTPLPVPAPVPVPGVAPIGAAPIARSNTSSQQWPGLFFGAPTTLPQRTPAPTPVPPGAVVRPTSTTARVPLSELPPGAQPSYLVPPPPPAPARSVKEATSTQWPGLFFGNEKTPAQPPTTTTPVATTAPAPASIAPAPIETPVFTPPVAAPARPAPTYIAPAVPLAPGDNPLTPFLTPLAQRPVGVSKINLPVRPETEKATPAHALSPATAPTLPAQPVFVPAPVAPPVAAPISAPTTVVMPPAFAKDSAPSAAPVFVPAEKATGVFTQPTQVGDTEVQREFLLNNGERISGRVVSETAETIYLHSESLGVLTIPRGQLAQKLREVILLNGDRIIGDVIAETDDFIYIRNASLGTLTIPKSHSSLKVIEVILKNGDRVVGELITESDDLILLKSATLGTLSVGRKSLEMVNRRLEHHPIKPLAD